MQLQLFLLIAAVVFGAILGSFLNALTFRYNTGQPLWRAMQGRSRCMRCGHTLGTLDLVPVLSWLALRGRCHYCGAKISVQYPLVELAAALLSLGTAMRFFAGAWSLNPEAWILYAFWLLVWLTILFLVVYDWRHMILPFGALMVLNVLAVVSLFLPFILHFSPFVFPSLWQFLAGPIVALPLALLSLISRGRWMGWGDSLLMLPLGWLLGLRGGATALIFAFWIGAFVGIVLLVLPSFGGRVTTLRSALPFGPFLAAGAAVVFFAHIDLFALLGL